MFLLLCQRQISLRTSVGLRRFSGRHYIYAQFQYRGQSCIQSVDLKSPDYTTEPLSNWKSWVYSDQTDSRKQPVPLLVCLYAVVLRSSLGENLYRAPWKWVGLWPVTFGWISACCGWVVHARFEVVRTSAVDSLSVIVWSIDHVAPGLWLVTEMAQRGRWMPRIGYKNIIK